MPPTEIMQVINFNTIYSSTNYVLGTTLVTIGMVVN